MGVAYVRLPSRVIDWKQATLEEDTLPPLDTLPYPLPTCLAQWDCQMSNLAAASDTR